MKLALRSAWVSDPAETEPDVSHFPVKLLVRLHDPLFCSRVEAVHSTGLKSLRTALRGESLCIQRTSSSYCVHLTRKPDKEQHAYERMFYFVILSASSVLPLSSIVMQCIPERKNNEYGTY